MRTSTPPADEHRHQLRALHHLALELSGLRDLASVLDVALRQCLELTGSAFGFIGLVQRDASVLEIAAIHGFHPAPAFYDRHRVIPLRPNVFSTAVLEDRPVRTPDARHAEGRVGQPPGHPEVLTFLGVPLRFRDRPIGMIGMANRPMPYTDDHERLSMTYAAQVAIVIHNAQLNEELQRANERLEAVVDARTRELHAAKDDLAAKAADLASALAQTVAAQERERQRIARDLHDGVNQLLIGAMLELTSAEQRIASDQGTDAAEALTRARDVLQRVSGELKSVVHDLHPPALEDLGLPSALRRLGEEFSRRRHTRCRATITGQVRRLERRAETDLYRIAQEALQNVATHAMAHHVELGLRFASDHCELEVRDDGCGFLPEVQHGGAGHIGLVSMRARAERLGGELEVRSRPGGGTTVSARVPA